MIRSLPLAFTLTVSAFLLSQLITAGPAVHVRGASAPATTSAGLSDIVQRRTVAAGERTVLAVRSSGVVEVVIFEHAGEPDLLQAFRAGRIPRTAKVFTNIIELAYPLASETGADFYVRVRPLVAGETTLRYEPGTIAQAMGRLRNGHRLIRNRGTVAVRSGLHQMPVYQLVPGTMIRLEVLAGRGSVALLKTRDYLAVRDRKATLVSRCTAGSCLRSETDGRVLGLRVADYDDRYLVAASAGSPLTFSYQIIATPEVLNYITTCL